MQLSNLPHINYMQSTGVGYNPYCARLHVFFCGYGNTLIYRLRFVMNFIGSLSTDRRIEFKTCALVYKCLHGVAPGYLSELMVTVAMDVGHRHLRSAARMVIWLFQHHERKLSDRELSRKLGRRAGIMFRWTVMIRRCPIVNSVLNWKHICIAK